MDSNSQDDLLLHSNLNSQDAAQPQASIVYCPSCGASVALPVVPPSNAGLFCDICTSPNLLVSTNDGVDWNPLSDAFNALSINSDTDTAQLQQPAAQPHQNDELEAQEETVTPTIQEEMKRRSLILSELMNFREALNHVRQQPDMDTQQPETQLNTNQTGQFEGNSSGGDTMTVGDTHDDDMSDMQRAFHQLLDFRQQNGMYPMDGGHMAEQDLTNMGYMPGQYDGYQQQLVQREEEEGMYDDPPIEYVNAHPPVQEEDWQYLQQQSQISGQTNVDGAGNVDEEDEYDDEGQIYATPQQRDEMRARMKELRMNPEMRERELLCKKYSVGRLGIANST
ncbi:hypothetical protein AA313_de0205860 [Arthrobotrys entomopaga]|nr:hypothetical protein AA313_de0205860 [Arthrobotrys entomopaga]